MRPGPEECSQVLKPHLAAHYLADYGCCYEDGHVTGIQVREHAPEINDRDGGMYAEEPPDRELFCEYAQNRQTSQIRLDR